MIPYDPTPPTEKRSCRSCGTEISARAQVCPACKIRQGPMQRCVACAQPIPKKASFCNACKTDQSWLRRHISISNTTLALLVAIAGAVSNAYTSIGNYLDRESNTLATVASADSNDIQLYVSNSGHKPSKLIGCRLLLGRVKIIDATLDLAANDKKKGGSIFRPGDGTIALTTTGLQAYRRNPERPGRYTKKDIEGFLKEQVTMKIEIEESNHRRRTTTESFPALRIGEFILHWVPDHDES